jgi:hypothetical protein
VFEKIINEHEARQEEGKKTGDKDLLSAMLRMKDETDLEIPITAATIQAVTFVSVEMHTDCNMYFFFNSHIFNVNL